MKSILKLMFLIVILQLFPMNIKAQESGKITNEMLNYKIDILSKIHDNTLDSIYRTLGTFITIFLWIIALNFFQNFTLNKRKLDEVKQNINNENELRFKERWKKAEETIQGKIKTQYESHKSNFDWLKEEYNDLKREFLIIKSQDYWSKGQLWEILCIIDALELDIKKGRDFKIYESLELIDKYLSNNTNTTPGIKWDIQKLLDKLPWKEYEVLKEKIEKAMRV